MTNRRLAYLQALAAFYVKMVRQLGFDVIEELTAVKPVIPDASFEELRRVHGRVLAVIRAENMAKRLGRGDTRRRAIIQP